MQFMSTLHLQNCRYFFAEKQKEEAVKKSMILHFMLQRISKRQQKIKEIHPSTMLNCFEILLKKFETFQTISASKG